MNRFLSLRIGRMLSLEDIARRADKLIWGEIREEKKRVPQGVKIKVYRRAGGKCEWSRCRKRLKHSEGEFHHWRDPPTERTTAFLCHGHHRDKRYKTHVYKVETDILGNKTVRIVRKRIKITPKKVK